MFAGVRSFINKWSGTLEVVIVNDGSRDNTERRIRDNSVFKENSHIFKLVSQSNTGKGGALRNGASVANGDFILTLDADMASPPEELLSWMKLMDNNKPDNHTIYIGSREHEDSIITKKGNRKFIGNVFNTMIRAFSPLRIRDTQCGFKLYPAPIAKYLFADLHTLGWAHDVEILYKAQLDKVQIKEMPLNWHAVEGSKIMVLRDGIKMFIELITIVIRTKLTYKSK